LTHRPHPLDRFLSELCSRSELDDADRSAFLNLPVRVRQLGRGAYLVRDSSEPVNCSVLVDGFAVRHKVTGDGSRQIIAVCIPGDAVDLQNMFLDTSDHSVQMLTRGTVGDLKRSDVQDLALSRAAIGAALIKYSLVEASILREWVVNIGRRDARAKIAHVLCEFAVRLEARGLVSSGFQLPMTQEQLADASGVTPVHVNRVLKGLEADGLITLDRGTIKFVDWRALQAAGDFNPRYLHLPGGTDRAPWLPATPNHRITQDNFNLG
jgi:CRP-like cAMP-binding protein